MWPGLGGALPTPALRLVAAAQVVHPTCSATDQLGQFSCLHFTGPMRWNRRHDLPNAPHDQGRLTRHHLDVPQPKGGTYSLDLTYSDFGTPVIVPAPPVEQVAGAG